MDFGGLNQYSEESHCDSYKSIVHKYVVDWRLQLTAETYDLHIFINS